MENPLSEFERRLDSALDEMIANPEKAQEASQAIMGNPIVLGPRVLAPEDWAKTQVERARAAATTWAERVKRPRKNPVEAAIAADNKRKDRLAIAEAEGKWVKRMKRVDIDEMYVTIDKVGASGFAAGIAARDHKIKRVVGELQPLVTALAVEIDKMPQATDAEREQRMLAARRGMIAIGKKRTGV
jgi:hypothetical protein